MLIRISNVICAHFGATAFCARTRACWNTRWICVGTLLSRIGRRCNYTTRKYWTLRYADKLHYINCFILKLAHFRRTTRQAPVRWSFLLKNSVQVPLNMRRNRLVLVKLWNPLPIALLVRWIWFKVCYYWHIFLLIYCILTKFAAFRQGAHITPATVKNVKSQRRPQHSTKSVQIATILDKIAEKSKSAVRQVASEPKISPPTSKEAKKFDDNFGFEISNADQPHETETDGKIS